MSWFTPKNTVDAVTEEEAPQAPPAPAPQPVAGRRWGKLTQIGSMWIDFDSVITADFTPADGCGAEIHLSTGYKLHLNAYGKSCLRLYFDQEMAKTDKAAAEVKELEALNKLNEE